MSDEWPIEEFFDEDYLHFAAPYLADDTTDAEAALVWTLLALPAGAEILDLACGHGRIANRLAGMGARVTGLDATPLFLDLAQEDAARRGVDVDYVHGDMRALPWVDRFDAVVNWSTSFGYFDDDQNRGVLTQVHRALRPGGRFLIELNHKDGLLPHWLPAMVIEVDGDFMIDQREFDPLTGRSNGTRTFIRHGQVRRSVFFTRLFSYTELRDWLLEIGFAEVEGCASDGTPLTKTARRMILVAIK
jgi:SAM-dependent methyltransferase